MAEVPMTRRTVWKVLGVASLAIVFSKLSGAKFMQSFLKDPSTARMPMLFIGHGSPMNAIEENPYSRALTRLGAELPKPRAILVISAHWMTKGTWVTEMDRPKTIHDFSGFPTALSEIQYPAPGSPELAQMLRRNVSNPLVQGDLEDWGLDHGTWAVLRHMYPVADIPVVQLSLDLSREAEYHFNIGLQLSVLRDQGVLILGSGNLVHNLRQIRWNTDAQPYEWAIEFDDWVKKKLQNRDFKAVLSDFNSTAAGRLSVPSMDHYYPLAYILGAANDQDELKFEYEELQNGSISMRSFRLG